MNMAENPRLDVRVGCKRDQHQPHLRSCRMSGRFPRSPMRSFCSTTKRPNSFDSPKASGAKMRCKGSWAKQGLVHKRMSSPGQSWLPGLKGFCWSLPGRPGRELDWGSNPWKDQVLGRCGEAFALPHRALANDLTWILSRLSPTE